MIRLIYDECNPTRDRRPTTAEDVENDIHVEEFDNVDELVDRLVNLAGYDSVEELINDYELENNDSDTIISEVMNILNDSGDGSPNILYLNIDGTNFAEGMAYDSMDGLDLATADEGDIIDTIIENEGYEYEDDDEDYEDDVDESWYKGIDDEGDQDFVEDEIEEDYSDDYKNERYQRLVGKKIRILHMDDPYAGKDYDGREGVIEYVATDPFGDVYFDGTWGSLSIYPKVDSFEYVDEKVDEGLFDAEKETTNYGHKAWVLNQIISSMNDETAYYDTEWLYLWPDGETEKECDDDFGDEESFKELEDTFISIYKYNSADEEGTTPEEAEYNFHRDGLYNPTKEAVELAHEYDKKLGLEPIKVLGKVKECVDDVRFAESVENDNLETFDDKMDFLAGDEEEAIDGYDEIIPEVEDEHIKDQLTHIRDEEKAHKKYLNDVKKDPSIDYEEPEDNDNKDNLDEALDTEASIALDDFIDNGFPSEIEYEDLDAPVHEDADDYPSGYDYAHDRILYTDIPARDGYIEDYTFDLGLLDRNECYEYVAKFLNKDLNSITKDDIENIDVEKLADFLYDELFDRAKQEAIKDFENGNYDSEDVKWIEPEEEGPDPDYEYERYRDMKDEYQ